MALNLAATEDKSEESPHYSIALQKILRQQELQDKLLRQSSPYLRILEEQRRFQQLTMPYQSTVAQIIEFCISNQAPLMVARATGNCG